jgi:hypothetical protein
MDDPRDDVLEERFFPTRSAVWRRHLPWLRLFDAFRLAIDYRKVLIALAAVLLWSGGDWLLSWLPDAPPPAMPRGELPLGGFPDGTAGYADATQPRTLWPWEARSLPPAPATRTRVELADAASAPLSTLQRALANGRVILWPVERMTVSAGRIVAPGIRWSAWIHSWLTVLWALTVTAVFGGILSRMAAVETAGQGDAGIQSAGGFSLVRLGRYLLGPLSTVVGLGLFWGLNTVAGLIARIPYLGDGLVSLFWFLPVIAGLFLALIVLGVAAGWPLMFAAVSVDNTDGYEALSRSYGYIFNRPWYALFLVLLVLLYGSVLLFFVTGMLTLAVDLATGSVETGLGERKSRLLLSQVPDHPMFPIGPSPFEPPIPTVSEFSQLSVGIWMRLLGSLPAAFVFSYFWVAVTLIYILLRHREDAIPLDEIVRPEERNRPPALSGIAAMNETARGQE